jgi:type I restriction enzyme M protein
MEVGSHPKQTISEIAEDLLHHYEGKPLIDAYDIYQHLLNYWETTMQDDCYLIAADGWKAQTYRVIEKDKKGKEKDKGWTCDLIPKSLVVDKFFSKEKAEMEKVTSDVEAATSQITEMEEEHGGDEGAFSELEKVNKASAVARLKEIKGDTEAKDEAELLSKYIELCESESEFKKKLKDLDSELDKKAYDKYPKLSETDIKNIVIENKWMAALDVAVHGEMDRVSQSLTARVKELAERYESAMPELVKEVSAFESKVNKHLKQMGFAWN